jgi:NADPH:quinone reductase-like Zn-dependent oxidoreductase
MTDNIPKTMRALALTKHCNPDEYGLADIPVPQITRPDEILVQVKAASINPIDVKLAGSLGKLIMKAKCAFPLSFSTYISCQGSLC